MPARLSRPGFGRWISRALPMISMRLSRPSLQGPCGGHTSTRPSRPRFPAPKRHSSVFYSTIVRGSLSSASGSRPGLRTPDVRSLPMLTISTRSRLMASSIPSPRSLPISSRGCLKRSIPISGSTTICSSNRSARHSLFCVILPLARTTTVSGRHRATDGNSRGCFRSFPTQSTSSSRCPRPMGSTSPVSSSRTGTSTTRAFATSGGS